MSATDLPTAIRPARPADVPLVLSFIRELAAYEKRAHEVVATEAALHEHLFGPRPMAEAVLAEVGDAPAAFALYFTTYSTFLGRPGIHLEDLFVRPSFRRRGIGRALLLHLAALTRARDYGRFEWTVLDWNQPAIDFYQSLGAAVLPDWRVCRLTGESLEKAVRP